MYTKNAMRPSLICCSPYTATGHIQREVRWTVHPWHVFVCVRVFALTGWCVQRVVDVIGHPGCEAPVVATVLQRHSSLCPGEGNKDRPEAEQEQCVPPWRCCVTALFRERSDARTTSPAASSRSGKSDTCRRDWEEHKRVMVVPKTHTFLTSFSTVTDLLYNPVFAGSEVIFRCIDEGNPEVEQQINDQRAGIFRQKDLKQRI